MLRTKLLLSSCLLTACTAALQATGKGVASGGGAGGSGGSGGTTSPVVTAPTGVSLSLLGAFSGGSSYNSSASFTSQSAIASITDDNLSVSNGVISPSGSGQAGNGSGANPASAVPAQTSSVQSPASLWATNPSSVSVSAQMDATYGSGLHPLCELLGTFSSVLCFPSQSFTFSLADWSGQASLQASAGTLEGGADATKKTSSNVIKLDHFVFEQVSNTSGSDTVDDVPSLIGESNSKFFFYAQNPSGYGKLYTFDGTSVTRLSNISGSETTGDGVNVINPTIYNNHLYFVANGTNYQLFWTDGTSIHRVSTNLKSVDLGAVHQGELYFAAKNSGGPLKVFRTNESRVEQITNLGGASNDFISGSGGVTEMAFHTSARFQDNGASLYFQGVVSFNIHLFELNGSTLTQLTNFGSSDFNSNYEALPLLIPGTPPKMFLGAYQSFKEVLMQYDGSQFKYLTSIQYQPGNSALLGSVLYFSASPSTNVWQLYKTDGNTVELVAVTSGSFTTSSYPSIVGAYNGWMYFVSQDPLAHYKLYRTQGTTVEQVSNLVAGGHDILMLPTLTLIDGKAYLPLNNANGKLKLFRLNGDSLEQVSDINGPTLSDLTYDEDPSGNVTRFRILTMGDYAYFPGLNANGKSKLMRFRWR